MIHKISRERVGKELLGMITGTNAHPERALGLLHSHNLIKSVFYPPLDVDILHENEEPHHVVLDERVWDASYLKVSAMHQYVLHLRIPC